MTGKFHQGDISHFNPNTAGRQCMANAIAAAVYATMVPMRQWDSSTLDRILLAGDALYSRRCNCQHGYLQFSDIHSSERIFYEDYIINGSSPMTGLLHYDNAPSVLAPVSHGYHHMMQETQHSQRKTLNSTKKEENNKEKNTSQSEPNEHFKAMQKKTENKKQHDKNRKHQTYDRKRKQVDITDEQLTESRKRSKSAKLENDNSSSNIEEKYNTHKIKSSQDSHFATIEQTSKPKKKNQRKHDIRQSTKDKEDSENVKKR